MTATTVTFALLAVAGLLILLRTLLGPTVADRVVGVDAVLIIVIAVVATAATAEAAGTLFVDVALVISLLAFIGTCIAARFVEERGR
jgi:multicomponent Na+:H+ antiporter subunit F